MPNQSHLIPAWQRRLDFARSRVAEYQQRIASAPPDTSHFRLDSLRREMERWRKRAQVLQQKINKNQP